MTLSEHENYSRALLSSLAESEREIGSVNFSPDRTQSRNAAAAMTAILCHRILGKSGRQPVPRRNTTYEWNGGIFNCRNIADRDYFWSNMRCGVADEMHEAARLSPVAYLFAYSNSSAKTLGVWALPEPLLYDAVSRLPPKKEGEEYTVLIRPERQRIQGYAGSPDLGPYFRECVLSLPELAALEDSRVVELRK